MHVRTKEFPQKVYKWSGISVDGEKITGQVQAFSLNLAKVYLNEQGIKLIKIHKNNFSVFTDTINISYKDINIFFRQLATLINAGIPLVQTLEFLIQNTDNFAVQNLLKKLKSDLENGFTFACALRKHSRYFDNMTCQLIHIAEQTGTLDTALIQLSNNREKTRVLTSQIKQALIYPVLMLTLACVITAAMMIFVIPRFAEIFADFHAKLPFMTVCLIQCAHILSKYYWTSIIPLLGMRLLLSFYRHSPRLQLTLDRWIIKNPLFGPLLQKFICTHLARTLAIMLKAGVSMSKALAMLKEMNNNSAMKAALSQLHQDINSGKRIHVAMRDLQVFPSLMTSMIKIGEESGSLDIMLDKIAEFYQAEISYWIGNFSQIIEPLIIIIIGSVIGSLVIALYLPIFKLGTVI